jgi:hypothetical protein
LAASLWPFPSALCGLIPLCAHPLAPLFLAVKNPGDSIGHCIHNQLDQPAVADADSLLGLVAAQDVSDGALAVAARGADVLGILGIEVVLEGLQDLPEFWGNPVRGSS